MRSPDMRETEQRDSERAPEERRPRVREAPGRLDEEELRDMKIIGAFRAVDRRDLPAHVRLERLLRQGLIARKTAYLRRGRDRAEVLVLTEKGRRMLESQQADHDAQRYWAGLVKPSKLEHDLAIYGAFREQAAAIEKAGGKVRRVVLDYKLKSAINREMNRAEGPPAAERRQRLAEEYELPVAGERLALPDLRIEYSDAEGRERHQDIDVVTRHYRGAHRAGKMRSGFRLVSAGGPRAAVNDDHHLGFWG
jgi:hypothetical protein